MIREPDDDAADQVEDDDDERGDRVAFDEFSGAVHCAVEIGFSLDRCALAACALGVEQSGVHFGIDRHLFAGHRVQREPRGNFGDASRARRDHDKLNRNEDREDDEADD